MHLTWLILVVWFIFNSTAFAQSLPSVGGECQYEQHAGTVKITSIHSQKRSSKFSYEQYEVKFTIDTMPDLDAAHSWIRNREFTLLLDNSSYPGALYLQKYGIEAGKVFDCSCHIITHGTCTPILFTFPDIRLDDYFETKTKP